MFWKAVGSGLAVLLHYQVWIGAALVAAASVGTMILTIRASGGSIAEGPGAAGCATTIMAGTLVQGVGLSIYLTFIIAIVLGGNQLLPISFLTDNFGTVVSAGLLGIVALFIASFIPVVGRSQAFGTFVQGVVVCRVLAGDVLEYAATTTGSNVVYPGIVASLGFLLIAFLLSQVAILILAIVTKETWAPLLAPPVGLVFGLLPTFMYMRYAVLPFMS